MVVAVRWQGFSEFRAVLVTGFEVVHLTTMEKSICTSEMRAYCTQIQGRWNQMECVVCAHACVQAPTFPPSGAICRRLGVELRVSRVYGHCCHAGGRELLPYKLHAFVQHL